MPTILAENVVKGGRADGENLWLAADDAVTATGWTFKPEGFCKGDVCVPVPAARLGAFVDQGEINVAALWQHLGLPLAHDEASETWVLGASAAERSAQLQSLEAPDFSLPDLAGKYHSMKEQRGKKVLLISWASW